MTQRQEFIDQTGSVVTVNFPPTRIISLVPSQTELLADLGLDASVVGITKFCIHPSEWRAIRSVVGGTKKFNYDIIRSLNPDLIIGNKEENYKEGIEILKSRFPVWMSDIVSLESALQMIQSIGAITGRVEKAHDIYSSIEKAFQTLGKFRSASVLYLIWKNPWMAAGQRTFINTMLGRIGLVNAVEHDRYPELDALAIKALDPEYIFLSSEPYPFRNEHIAELLEVCPHATVTLVDGEMFSWYGSRLLHAPDYFNGLKLS